MEERAARRGGARTIRVGLGAKLGTPDEPFIAFGLAGALTTELRPATLVTATRVVDEAGLTLWEGEPVRVPGARPVVLCATRRFVDGARERGALAERSGAVAVDMESATLAAAGLFRGAVRAISDTPARDVGRLAFAAGGDGSVDWTSVLASFARDPVGSYRTALMARRALAALEEAAAALASPEPGR